MDNLNEIISTNLKRIREERKLSLDKVSELTGVSKSMLGQIERGESNPTIATIWKIASGMKVSFTSILNKPQADKVIVEKKSIEPLIEDNGKYRLYPIFPYEDGRRFEIYTIEMEKGSYLDALPHSEGTQEFLTVYDGEITVLIDQEESTIRKGDSIRFKSDRPHAYHNSGSELARFNLVIFYREK